MKQVAYVEDFQPESPAGEPYFRVPGSDKATTVERIAVQVKDEVVEQALDKFIIRQIAFLLERVSDENFVSEKLTPVEADLHRADVRGMIKRQAKAAKERGYWEFTDDVWSKLFAATMTPKGQISAGMGFNYAPLIIAVRDAKTAPNEIELPPATNGAVARA